MDRLYAEAFRSIGIDIDTTPAADIGRQIRSRNAEAQESLIVTLDDWSLRFKPENYAQPPPPPPGLPPREAPEDAHQDSHRRSKILEAAIAADRDEWRNRLRRAILAEDRKTLDEMSASIATDKPPVMSLLLLSHALARGEEINDQALEVLLQAYRIHPADFWISFFIAHGVVARKSDHRMMGLAERHARITIAANPKAPHAYGLLAAALFAKGRAEDRPEAIEMLRKGADLDPGRWGEMARMILKVHETGDPAAREEIRRRAEGRRHPPMMQVLFDSVTR